MEPAIKDLFTLWDWAVIVGYLLLTTVVGHMMRGKQGTIRDFFLGGRSLPWQAVSGSIIATEISGVTFIGVAGTVFALQGDFTYLLWGLGSIMGRIIVAYWFVPRFYEEEIYSPYDYMGRRIGPAVKKLATVVFTIGSILGQSVRVFVAAIPLKVVTGLDIQICIVAIGLFAIGWTLMGGMRTVIWTDVMQFFLFTFGGLLTLFWIVNSLDGGWGEYWTTANDLGRTKTWDARWGFGPELKFTFWVAILAVPFQNLTAFGVDQLNAQRMFCCKDAKSASKALVWSSFGQLMTLMMLLVGAALVVHYDKNPFTPQEGVVLMDLEKEKGESEQDFLNRSENILAEAPRIGHPEILNQQSGEGETASEGVKEGIREGARMSAVAEVKQKDNIFPMWIVKNLPVGLSGLILAGIFAAAISSLDSILAALSQTTLSLLYHPEKKTDEELEALNLVTKSRILVVIWGILLTAFTVLLSKIASDVPVLPLAFGMTAYTMGPMLGIFLCSLIGRGNVRGLSVGFALSFLLTLFVRMDIWVILKDYEFEIDWLAGLPTYELVGEAIKPTFGFVWMWPLTTIVTLLCGLFLFPSQPKVEKDSEWRD